MATEKADWGSNYIFTEKQWQVIEKNHQLALAVKDQQIVHLEEEVEKQSKLARQWQYTAEEESWPYEWVIATQQKEEITKLNEEVARLKKALRIADEAVNIATGE